MPLNAQVSLSILTQESSVEDLSKTTRVTPAAYAVALTDGTGANQAQVAWSDARTVAGLAVDTINPTAGFAGFVDDRGTVTFSAVKLVYVKNTGSSRVRWEAENWSSGPQSTNGGSAHGLIVKPGSVLVLAAADADGWPTSGGSMVFRNLDSGPALYEVLIVGKGAVS